MRKFQLKILGTKSTGSPSEDGSSPRRRGFSPSTPTARSDQQSEPQAAELARSHALIAALSQVASHLEASRGPDGIIETLGVELRDLNLNCAISELVPGTRQVITRHHTINPRLQSLAERLAGIRLGEHPISIEALQATQVIDELQPLFICDVAILMSQVWPNIPRLVMREAARLIGLTKETRAILLPLVVDAQIYGILTIWGEELFESDVPTLAMFARQVGAALDNARLLRQVQGDLIQRTQAQDTLQRSQRDLQRRAEELTTMLDLARVVASSLDLNDVLAAVVRTLLSVTGAGGVTLSRWDREADVLETWVQERADGLDFSDQDVLYDLDEYPASRAVLEGREPLLAFADDPDADPAEATLMRSRDIATLLMVPLTKGETTVGLVEIDDRDRIDFSPDDIRLCQAIAQQAALAIENARLHAETERQLWRQTVLRQVAGVIYASLDHEEVLDRLAEQFAIAVDATSAYICTYEHSSYTSTIIAEYVDLSANPAEQTSDLYSKYTFPEYPNFLETLDIEQYHWDDPCVCPAERLHLQQYGCQSVMIVPLQLRGQITAYIEIWESRSRRNFTSEEQSLCQEIAQQAAIAIENASLYNEVQQRLHEQTLINEAAEIILDSLDLTDVATRLAERLCSAIDATSAYFCLCNRPARNLTVIAEYISPYASPPERESDLGQTYPDEDLSYQDTLQRSSLVVEHFDDAHLQLGDRDHMLRYGVKSVIFIPLNQIGKDSLGVLEVWETRRRREFTPGELRLCRTIARQATIAIEKARLYAKAQQEIGERKAAQEKLKRSEMDYRGLFENAHDPVIIFDPQLGQVLDVNQRACEVYGYGRREMIGISLERIGQDSQIDKNHLRQILESGRYYNYQTVHARKDGSQMHVEVNLSLVHYQGHRAIQSINRDVTERVRTEEQLRFEAFHDQLTGLPNRALFKERLEHAIIRLQSRRQDTTFAVLFLDLDRFKNVNDSRGHPLGDLMLEEVARRLTGCVRTADTVARLGGDEFVILMEDIDDIRDATILCERINEQLEMPVDLGGEPVFTSASIGVVLSDAAYRTPEEYLRDADIAMYRAKGSGRGRFEVFDTTMRERIMQRLALESELRRAITNQEFVLHYMPIVSLQDGAITGFEALLRWQHPGRGLLLPREFIEVAEETGMIVPIGNWVLQEACRQMQAWRTSYLLDHRLRMSINLSGEQLNQPDFVEQVRKALESSDLPPFCLSLEVTESSLIKDVDTAISALSKLKAIGISLQLDDFGTGYSSLSYLRQFPIDVIKIDRSFILKYPAEKNAPDLVRTIILMGQELGLEVIAEGIETDEQASRLRQLGCDQGQGFLFSKAVDAPSAEKFLLAQGGEMDRRIKVVFDSGRTRLP